MKIEICTEKFNSLAEKLASSLNERYKVSYYTAEFVETTCAMIDFQDGTGPQFVTNVAVRRPSDFIIDVTFSTIGGPIEAMEGLLLQIPSLADMPSVAETKQTAERILKTLFPKDSDKKTSFSSTATTKKQLLN